MTFLYKTTLVVFTVFGISFVVARFATVMISCDCILDFGRSGSMILPMNGPSGNVRAVHHFSKTSSPC